MRTTIVAAIAVALVACGAPQVSGSDWVTLKGVPAWRYAVHVPANGSGPAPLLLALHGAGGDAQSVARLWGWEKTLSDVIVVAPQAPNRSGTSTWRAGKDEDALLAILDEVRAKYDVDDSRTAIAGYSSGAGMAFRMAVRHPDRFRACVAIGGGRIHGERNIPTSVSFFLLAGERDRGFGPKKAERLAETLRASGVTAEAMTVRGADHITLYSKVAPAAEFLARSFRHGDPAQ
ncbi:MAG: dienelactone hydrolase family protein [Deltaproteobacteria bacterium]|nr:dienelactone hydrolase family protein [Deltaproteobacteria bacterium]